MTDREELRRLIDVIEKGSASSSIEQAVDDIKIFANTASFLANKLDARVRQKSIAKKKKPKSRIGAAITPPPIPKPRTPKPAQPQAVTHSGMPKAQSTATSQADFDRLKPRGSQGTIAPS